MPPPTIPYTKPPAGAQINPLHPLSKGLVGYWLFNEGAGSRANDISGKGNHGTLTNMLPNVQGSGWGGSKFGGGLEFDGSGDYVSLPSSIPIDYLSWDQDYSIETWVKANDIITPQEVLLYSSGSTNRAGLRIRSGIIGAGTYNGTVSVYASGAITSGWHYISVVHNANNTVLLYIDGILQTGTSANSFSANNYCRISSASNNINGSINFVRIYNRALSAKEVKILYHDPFCNLLRVPVRYVAAGGTIRELLTTIAAATATSSANANILRELTTTSASQTAMSASGLLILRELSAAIASATTTSSSGANILREIDTTIATATVTSNAGANVLRELTSTIAAVTSLSEIELLIGVLRELAATIAVSTSTSAAELAVLRELTSTLTAQTESTASLSILRDLTATIAAGTSLSEIELLLGTLRELTTTIAATTTTSTSEFLVLRELTSTVAAQSASNASINILRELEAIIAAGTSLSEIELIIGELRELAATISASTATSTAQLNVVRAFTTTISATASTSAIAILMVRALSAQIAAGTDTGQAALLVLREFSASIDATTLTSTITLLVSAAGLIVDTEIQSLTLERILSSITAVREIQEM